MSSQTSTLSVATLNLNGARDGQKRLTLFDFIALKQITVMFVQETHCDVKCEVEWRKDWKGRIFFSHKTSLSGGVAILFSKGFLPLSCEVEEIVEGRLMMVKAVFEKHTMIFLNVYAPTNGAERILFFDKISEVLSDLDPEALFFMGGDFNCTAEDKLDRNHLEPHAPSQKAVIKLMNTYELCDLWRTMHHGIRQYTWAQSRDSYISLARLDRIYVYKHHLNLFKECHILPTGFSDHCAVICKASVKAFKPKSAYWCFNTSLLGDKHFRDTFIFFWETFRQQKVSFTSLQQWWDYGKVQIKLFCQQYTFSVTNEIIRSLKGLEEDIMNLQELVTPTGAEEQVKLLKEKKGRLSELLGVRAQGALVRSRFQSASLMDAPSKFFFGLERKNGQSRMMHTLRSEEGQEFTEPAELRNYAMIFYSKLYESELVHSDTPSSDMPTGAFLSGLPKVTEESHAELEKVLTLQELEQALMSMENDRAPGIDGLQIEFYKTFWPSIGQDLLEVLRGSLEKGCLPLSCRRAVITLLPKKGDLQNIGNWRPVSLLCSDKKLLSKSLAMRLKKVIGQVIHPDQSYCIPDRSIFDNIALVRDLLTVSRNSGCNLGLISLDQQKAFDRVEHQYLWSTLASFGFSSGFIAMVKTMYCNIESVLKVNGGLSAPFKVKRGVRQGCPMSGMLYAIAIEPLLHKLRTDLRGFSVPCCLDRFFLSAYADDVMVFVNDKDDVVTLENTVKAFQCLSSARVNWGKSEALWVGEWGGRCSGLPGGLLWKKEGLKYLGVFLGDDSFVSKNWEGVFDKVKGRLGKWKWLLPQLSYRGRILITNNLVASSLWHKFACMEPPALLLDSIQKEVVDFFWDKMHWVPQAVLFLSREDGGQGLMNLVSRRDAYRLQFIQRLLTAPKTLTWRPLAHCILHGVSKLGLDVSLFQMDAKQLVIEGLPLFYRSIFRVWGLFYHQWVGGLSSVHWLLEEPIVLGSRFDVAGEDFPGIKKLLCEKMVLKLRHLVGRAGCKLQNAQAVASCLGIKSVRYVERFLGKLNGVLNLQEKSLLEGYSKGNIICDGEDIFPNILLLPAVQECGHASPLLVFGEHERICLFTVTGKVLYRNLVKLANRRTLEGRTDTVWRDRLGINDNTKPVWRVLYKQPLTKRTGDLQWRILHGAIAVNAVIAKINPEISDKCPFCVGRETIYHCFMDCNRLSPLFCMLSLLFFSMGTMFTKQGFIIGFSYNQRQRSKCQLLNFIVGQAKLAIYLSRRNKVRYSTGDDVKAVFKNLVKSRIGIDFHFYNVMSAIDVFKDIWCGNGALCAVKEDELVFAPFLNN